MEVQFLTPLGGTRKITGCIRSLYLKLPDSRKRSYTGSV